MLTKGIYTCTSCLLLALYTPQCNEAADLLGLGLFDCNGNGITVGTELLLQQQQDLLDGFNDIRAVDSATAAAMADNTNANFYGGIGSSSMCGNLAQSSSSSPEAVAAAEAAAARHGPNLAANVSIYHHCTNAYCSCTS
jgi:hypothetical protein